MCVHNLISPPSPPPPKKKKKEKRKKSAGREWMVKHSPKILASEEKATTVKLKSMRNVPGVLHCNVSCSILDGVLEEGQLTMRTLLVSIYSVDLLKKWWAHGTAHYPKIREMVIKFNTMNNCYAYIQLNSNIPKHAGGGYFIACNDFGRMLPSYSLLAPFFLFF